MSNDIKAQLDMEDKILRVAGNTVRAARISNGMTQLQLADACRIDRKTINRIENGQHAMRITTMVRVFGALQIPMGALGVVEQ